MPKLTFSIGTSYKAPIGKARILGEHVDEKMFAALAKSLRFSLKKPDNTLLGYYYANENGDVLKTYPSYHKADEIVSL